MTISSVKMAGAATLAREAQLPYATLSVVVNEAAGRGASRTRVELAKFGPILEDTIARAVHVLEFAVAA